MFEDLKARGNKNAARRSVTGLLGGAGLFVIFYLNLFGISEETYARWKWIGLGAGALVIVCSAVLWLRAARASGTKAIEKFCAASPNYGVMMRRLEQTWQSGLDFKLGRMDSEYIIMSDGLVTKVVPLADAVWVYKHIAKVNHVSTVYVYIEYREGKGKRLECGMNDSAANQAIAYIMEHVPNVCVGHDKARERMFREKDFAGLRENARVQRVAAGIATQ